MIPTSFWVRFWIHSNKFFDQRFVKALFLKSFEVCNFWKKYYFVFLDRSKCRANYDMNPSIPLCSKRCKKFFWNMWRSYMGYKLHFKYFLKSTKPIVLFVSDRSLIACMLWSIFKTTEWLKPNIGTNIYTSWFKTSFHQQENL